MLKRDFDVKYLSLTGNLEPVLRAETGLVGVVAASTLTECRVLGDGRCWSIVDRVWSIIFADVLDEVAENGFLGWS